MLTGSKEQAVYTPSEDPMYRHNPFIEALPPVLPMEKVASLLRRHPVYHQSERELAASKRLEAVQRIANYVEPLPIFLELEQRFSRMLRNGYSPRNPISAEWIKQLRSGFPDLDWDRGKPDYQPLVRSTAAGFAIIGTSGVGKTTAVESVLSLYAQQIQHSGKYGGRALDRVQLVWLKLECPQDGSLRGLCLNFFQAVDEIVGTRYYPKFGNNRRRSVDELLPEMANVAAVLGLGVLVIDEIQRLNEASSGGAAKMLNFFGQMVNQFSVPVVLVGTFKALPLLSGEFAQARRSAGQGDLVWSNLPQDDVWDFFIEGVWHYQWTKSETPLTPTIRNALYQESQGIVDIAVKLYMLAQWAVIGQEDETISPELIGDVARDSLQLARPILEALKKRDLAALGRIKDIMPPISDLEQYLRGARERVTLEGTLDTMKAQRVAQQQNAHKEPDEILMRVAEVLLEAGFPVDMAHQCAEEALKQHADETELAPVIKDALLRAVGVRPPSRGTKRNPSRKDQHQETQKPAVEKVLTEMINARKGKITPHQALNNAGVIKPIEEFWTNK